MIEWRALVVSVGVGRELDVEPVRQLASQPASR